MSRQFCFLKERCGLLSDVVKYLKMGVKALEHCVVAKIVASSHHSALPITIGSNSNSLRPLGR